MRWEGHVTRMGKRRGAYRVLVGKRGGRPLGRPRHRRKDNIKKDLQEVGWGYGLDWSGSGYGQVAGPYKCGDEIPGSTNSIIS